eukprot:s57_g69.t1
MDEIVESASSTGDPDEDADSPSDNEEKFFESHRSMMDCADKKAVEGDLMQNLRSKMLHLKSPDKSNDFQPVTVCGLHGAGFTHLPDGSTFAWPKCSCCFKDEAPKDQDLVTGRCHQRRQAPASVRDHCAEKKKVARLRASDMRPIDQSRWEQVLRELTPGGQHKALVT